MRIVFGAVLQAEMITVDSSDPQTSPDSNNTSSELGMLLRVQDTLRLGFVGLGHFDLFKLMLALFHVEHNFSIWHLRNLATLEPKIANVLGSKVKLLAHCCHDSVESLISTSEHIIDMHTEHSMDFSTPKNNAHGPKAQLVNPCSMSGFLAHLLIHTTPFSTAALFHDRD